MTKLHYTTMMLAAAALMAGCGSDEEPMCGPCEECDDGGADTDADTDTDPCDGACADPLYTACSCGQDDPCGWAGDGICDEECVELGYVEQMFDDTADCDPTLDGGADADADADADTDTADAGTDAGTFTVSDSACSCAAIGGTAALGPEGLLRLIL